MEIITHHYIPPRCVTSHHLHHLQVRAQQGEKIFVHCMGGRAEPAVVETWRSPDVSGILPFQNLSCT